MNIRHHCAYQAITSLLLALLLHCAPVLADDIRKVYVIEMHHHFPDDLIPAIKPLLNEGDSISTYHNQLIVITTPFKIHDIQQLVDKLDTPQHNLVIGVRNNRDATTTEQGSSASGGITTSNVRIDTGQAVGNQGISATTKGVTISTQNNSTSVSTRREQLLRAVEGRAAFIATGEMRMSPTRDELGNIINTEVSAIQGFYVTVHVMDDTVQLDISITDDSFDDNSDSSGSAPRQIQHLKTTVSGKLGEWISLGGINLEGQDQSKGLVKKITTSGNNFSDIALRVLTAD